jgi:hypothetical protein
VSGTLKFVDGILVQALRPGHWVILDELNLAPSLDYWMTIESYIFQKLMKLCDRIPAFDCSQHKIQAEHMVDGLYSSILVRLEFRAYRRTRI